MEIQVNDTIDCIINSYPATARILSKHGIDFCSEGHRTLKDACTEAEVSIKRLLREITKASAYRKKELSNPSTASVDELTRYIETYHHQFTAETIVFIKTSLNRLVRLHGAKYPELAQIRNPFDEVTGPITVHMQHEEFIVFPYIRDLARKGKKVKSPIFRSANSPIAGLINDHMKSAMYLKKLDVLTNHFSPPAGEGTAFRITYAAMRELEKDINTHLRLEDEILFPRAIEMEVRLSHGLSAIRKDEPISSAPTN